MIEIIISLSLFIIVVSGQTCSTQYKDFSGICISDCTTIPGAINPQNFGETCLCSASTPFIKTTNDGCISNCQIINAYKDPNPLMKRCVANCPPYISGSVNPTSYGEICKCNISNYFISADDTQCVPSCSKYYSFNKILCVDACSLIPGASYPPEYGLPCVCQNGNSYLGPDGMSCVTSCTTSYKHIDPTNHLCINDCPTSIPNSHNPTSFGQACICNSGTPNLSLDRTQCIASCPLNSSSVSGICKCTSSFPYINLTATSCVSSCTSSYINFDTTYPQCVSSCTGSNVLTPSFNQKCYCWSGAPYLNQDNLNNYYCNSGCTYYKSQDPTDFTCKKDCNGQINITNPSSLGQECTCTAGYYLQPNKLTCDTGCISGYKGLNPIDKFCYSNCVTSFPNAINPGSFNTPCQCPSNFKYVSNDFLQCTNTCTYYSLNPYNYNCINSCTAEVSNSSNPSNALDQNRCQCLSNSLPYLSQDNKSCVSDCNSSYISIAANVCVSNCANQPSANNPNYTGLRCYCSPSFKYLSEDLTNCVASCTKYYHPNPKKLICINDCTLIGMINPGSFGQACQCGGTTPYLDVSLSKCLAACPSGFNYNGNNCSCGVQQADLSISGSYTCITNCNNSYYHIDQFSHLCLYDCPSQILGSVNPSTFGQKCQCPSNRPFIRIDMQGQYYCDQCPYYFIGTLCVEDCTQYTNMANPSSQGQACICSNPNYYFNLGQRECVATCPDYIHVIKKECVSTCSDIPGAVAPTSGNVCVCSSSNPIYDYSSSSCVNVCNYSLHPNPTIKKCYNDCPNQIPNSSSPIAGTNFCSCQDPSKPYLGLDTNGNVACIDTCNDYLFYYLCTTNCSVFPNAQNPPDKNISNQCVCNSSAKFRDSFHLQCVSACPVYVTLNPNSNSCVLDCAQFPNSITPSANGGRCSCGSNSYPYVKSDGSECVSDCTDYYNLNPDLKLCVNNCQSAFSGSKNPIFGGYQCECNSSTPYKSIDLTSCVSSCPSNQTINNGACQCSGSTPYLSEDGTTCVSSCPNYIHPNPSKKQCVSGCQQFLNFQNPPNQNQRCICVGGNEYIRQDFSQCDSGCFQSFLHFTTDYLLCVKDCPSQIQGAKNPSSYNDRCLCDSPTPYISLDMSKCIASCTSSYIHINKKQCISQCSSISGATASGNSCVCQSGLYINIDSKNCIASCPLYSKPVSGQCQCTKGYNSSTNTCDYDSTNQTQNNQTTVTDKSFSNYISFINILIVIFLLI